MIYRGREFDMSKINNETNRNTSEVVISIIMPVYNAAEFLKDSIEDVLVQTYRDFELICVDDGSTDESNIILDEFAEKDSRIIVIHQENGGGGAARNTGMSIASGKYLLFLDADDRFEDCLLNECLSKAEEMQCDILTFNADTFDNETGERKPAPWLVKNKTDTIKGNPFRSINTTVWNKIFRKEYIVDKGLHFQTNRIVDTMSFVGAAIFGTSKIAILHKVLLHYRTNNRNSIIANSDKYPLDIYFALDELNRYISEYQYTSEKLSYYYEFAIENIRTRLNMFKTYEGFRELYICLHNGGLEDLGLTEDIENPEQYIDWRLIQQIRHKEVDEYLYDRQTTLVNSGINSVTSFEMPKELLEKCEGKQIWLHGGGMVGRNYFIQLMNKGNSIVGWTDKDESEGGYPIISVRKMINKKYDIIIIAVESGSTAELIKNDLISNGVSPKRILWEKPNRV